MSDAKNPNSQSIFNTVVATVITAALFWVAQLIYSAANPPNPLSASVSAARVAMPPTAFIEGMQSIGCDDTVPFGDNLAMMESHDRRIAACTATVTQVLDPLKDRSFRQIRVQIENRGRALQENIRVIAPGFAYARATIANRPTVEFVPDQPISVGDLAPGESAEVQVWAEQSYSPALNDLEVYSNSGRSQVRADWADLAEIDELSPDLESAIISLLNGGWAPLLAAVFAVGALILFVLMAALVEAVVKKIRGEPLVPQQAPPQQ